MRRYKLGVLRGVLDNSEIAEEIVFGTLKTHDMEQCREMLHTTSCFHEHDILSNDRGFLSWEITEKTAQPETERAGNPASDRPWSFLGEQRI